MLAEESRKLGSSSLKSKQEAAGALLAALLVAAAQMWLWGQFVSLGELFDFDNNYDSYEFFYDFFQSIPLVPIFAVSVAVYVFLRQRISGAPARTAVLTAMYLHLEQGRPLSEILRGLSRFFPARYADLAAAGERTGNLAATLTQLESEASQQLLESGRSRGARVYLILLVIICLAIGVFLAIKILPVFKEILEEFGVESSADQPWIYSLEYAIDFVAVLPPVAAAPVVALIVFAVFALRQPMRRAALSRFTLRLPWVGYTNTLRSLRHAALMLAPELDAGIPLPEAVGHVCSADIHPAHRRVFERVRARLMQGDSMTDTLRHAGDAVPPGFLHFVALGESSGQLPESLRQVAQLYGPVVSAREAISRTLLLCAGVLAVSSLVYVVVVGVFSANVAIVDACINAL